MAALLSQGNEPVARVSPYTVLKLASVSENNSLDIRLQALFYLLDV